MQIMTELLYLDSSFQTISYDNNSDICICSPFKISGRMLSKDFESYSKGAHPNKTIKRLVCTVNWNPIRTNHVCQLYFPKRWIVALSHEWSRGV